jgi:hypothetical protein
VHRPQHFVGHGGGSGDCQEFPARANGHFVIPFAIAFRSKACRGMPGNSSREGMILQ